MSGDLHGFRIEYGNVILVLDVDIDSASETAHQAVVIDESRIAAAQADQQMQYDLSRSYLALAESLSATGRLTEAREFYEKSKTICRKIADNNPQNGYYHDSLGEALLGFSIILLKQNEADKAIEAAREAIGLWEITVKKDPTDIFTKALLAKGYAQLGECQFFLAESSKELTRKHEYFTAAKEWLRKSTDIWLSLKNNMVLAKYFERESFAVTNRISACETALAKVQRQ